MAKPKNATATEPTTATESKKNTGQTLSPGLRRSLENATSALATLMPDASEDDLELAALALARLSADYVNARGA